MSKRHKFEIKNTGDESEEIYLNGKKLISTNHDDHGWMGMELARELVKDIAKEIGAEVEETDSYEETEEDE